MNLSQKTKRSAITIALLIVIIVVLALVFNVISDGRFITRPNINSLLINAVIASFAAWGCCFIFALNYMDLSIGAVITLVVYASGELGNLIGPTGVVIAGVVTGVIAMSINFNVFAWSKVPSWVAGIGLCLIYEAILSQYSLYKQSIGDYVVKLNDEYAIFGRAPGAYIVFIIGLVLAYFIYNRSMLGLNARSVGSNPNVAKSMGINVMKTLILTGIVCGIFIGTAGFLRESYSLRVTPTQALASLAVVFPPLAAMFVAQVLSKWINIIIAVPFCALIIYICYNVLSILGVPSGTLSETLLGAFIIIFGVIAQRGTKEVVK